MPQCSRRTLFRPNPFSSPLRNPPHALDLSSTPSTATRWAIIADQIAPANAGREGGASNAGTLTIDMSGIQVAIGNSASMLHTAQDFEQSLSSMAEVKPAVTFYAEDVTVRNAALLERPAKRSMSILIHITSALTIPTPAGPAIVSLTMSRTTTTARTT